jgi:replication factor C subunit 1
MDEYYLTKEDWDNMIDFGSNDKLTSSLYKQIPSNVKSAFTRT